MSRTMSRSAVVVGLLLSVACRDFTPTPPPPVTDSTLVAPPFPPFPPLAGPSRTFNFERELVSPVGSQTKDSRFILYDDGAAVLQYPSFGPYRGGYTRGDNDTIAFVWEGGGIWAATGTLNGNSLTVRYNFAMGLDGFDDAVYVEVQ